MEFTSPASLKCSNAFDFKLGTAVKVNSFHFKFVSCYFCRPVNNRVLITVPILHTGQIICLILSFYIYVFLFIPSSFLTRFNTFAHAQTIIWQQQWRQQYKSIHQCYCHHSHKSKQNTSKTNSHTHANMS